MITVKPTVKFVRKFALFPYVWKMRAVRHKALLRVPIAPVAVHHLPVPYSHLHSAPPVLLQVLLLSAAVFMRVRLSVINAENAVRECLIFVVNPNAPNSVLVCSRPHSSAVHARLIPLSAVLPSIAVPMVCVRKVPIVQVLFLSAWRHAKAPVPPQPSVLLP